MCDHPNALFKMLLAYEACELQFFFLGEYHLSVVLLFNRIPKDRDE